MNRNRRKLSEASLLAEYESAFAAGRPERLRAILAKAGFNEMEIESIMWAKGDLGPEAPELSISDKVMGVVGQTLISALVVGFMAAYCWGGFAGSFSSSSFRKRQTERRIMSDYRTPYEACYRPFLIGCGVGAVLPHAYRLLRKRRET